MKAGVGLIAAHFSPPVNKIYENRDKKYLKYRKMVQLLPVVKIKK